MRVTSAPLRRRINVVLYEFLKTSALKRVYSINFILLLASILTTISVSAADHFWVGESGNWNDPSHWSDVSGGSGGYGVPTATDNVFFNAESFSADGHQVVIVGSANCAHFIWDGLDQHAVFSGAGTASLTVNGSYILHPGVTNQFAGTTTFTGSFQGNVIEPRRIPFQGDIVISGSGHWTLYSNILMPNSGITLVEGSLNTQGQVGLQVAA
jgi:hypothetical protein